MPLLTTVLQDTSPLLVYSSNWRAGTSADDSSADKYSESSFTVTQITGATVSLRFYGSSVTVIGARRGNHGSYSADIDALPPSTQSGHADPDQFNQVLYNANVSPGFHNLTITNGENLFFDVDYVMLQSSIGVDNEDLIVNTFQDSHPSFTYAPPSSWKSSSNMIGSFESGSGHATTDPSAVANFAFQPSLSGDAVALYGPVGPNCSSSFSVQIDGDHPSIFSAHKQFFRSQQILFFAANLGGGVHSLKIQLVEAPITGELAIDYASVYTTSSLGGSFLVASSPASMHKGHSITIGKIIALAVVIPVAIIIILFSIYLQWLRRRSRGLPVYGDRISHSLRNHPDAIQPFSLSEPADPRPPNPQRSLMAEKFDALSALRGHHGDPTITTATHSQFSASSFGPVYVITSASASTSAQGATSENSAVAVENQSQNMREGFASSSRNGMSPGTVPPPEYTQTSNNQ